MRVKMRALSREYESALGDYLKDRTASGLRRAAPLGTHAVALGLETLDLAKIHEQALAALDGAGSGASRDGRARRAQTFFVEANGPIERTHLAAAAADLRWNKLNETLHERTSELAVSKRDVKTNIVRRKAAEESLKTSKEYYAKLLKESLSMQESLRRLTHRVLSGQENERGNISRELRDEIAQILLGINVCLSALRQQGSRAAKQLSSDIAATQRLVDKSIKGMRRTARKLGTPDGK